jgi:hypothetical protein
MKALRMDLVFSYWIYLWYILYAFKFIKYSPKLALTIGLVDNIIMLLLMIYFNSSIKTIITFIIVNTFIKIIPLYYLRNEHTKVRDVLFTCFLFLVFMLWLHINSQSLIGNLKLIHDSLLYNENKTPIMSLLAKIEKNFRNLRIL